MAEASAPPTTATSPLVAVINQSLAHSVYPNVDPVGKTFVTDLHQGDPEAIYQIIGVSADAKYDALQEDPPPHLLHPLPPGQRRAVHHLHDQDSTSPAAILPALRNAVQSIDKDLPLRDIRTQTEQIEDSISQQRLSPPSLLGSASSLSPSPASASTASWLTTFARRTSEIGVRMALGARTRQVLFMILRESSSLAILGIAAGLIAAIALTRFVGSMLYGLKPSDPTTLIAATLILLAVAIAAAYGPARRASRIDPMQACVTSRRFSAMSVKASWMGNEPLCYSPRSGVVKDTSET